MSKVISLKEYSSQPGRETLEICFFSPKYRDKNGNERSFSISLEVKCKDFETKIAEVAESGGVGQVFEDGVYRFLPWPCVVEMRVV